MEVATAWRAPVHATACARFSTVLSPCFDGNHEEHVHVDLAERHAGYETCEWQVREPVKLAKTTAPQEGEPQAA